MLVKKEAVDSLPVCGFFFVCTGRDAKVCFDGQWDLKKKQTGGLQEGKGFVTIFRKAAVEEKQQWKKAAGEGSL